MPADITLKIDADTASYIAQIAKMAAANEKANDAIKSQGISMEKVGDAAVTVAQKMAGVTVPLTAIGAGIAAVTAAWEAWRASIDKTKDALEKTHQVNQVIGRAGRQNDLYEVLNATADGGMINRDDQTSFLKSYLAPEGIPKASGAQITQAAADAKAAKKIGYEPGEYTDVRRGLERSGVENPGDLALYYLQNVGGATDKMMQATAKLPGQAESIAKIGASANRLGRSGLSMVGSMVEQYTKMGSQGTLSDFIKQQGQYFGGFEDPATYNALVGGIDTAPDVASSRLATGAGQLGTDPIERAMRDRGAAKSRAEFARTGASMNRDIALREIRAEGTAAEYDATTTGGRVTRGAAGLVATVLPAFMTPKWAEDAHRATAGYEKESFDLIKDMRAVHARKVLPPHPSGDER